MKKLLWLDIETTGLDEVNNVMLQIGLVVTNEKLKVLDKIELDIYQPKTELAKMNDYVRKMHTTSGLITRISKAKKIKTVEKEMIKFYKKHFGTEKVVTYGNSVHFDRRFIRKQMNDLDNLLSFRIVDVSSLREVMSIYKPGHDFEKKYAHTAIDDCLESIGEYKNYLKALGML